MIESADTTTKSTAADTRTSTRGETPATAPSEKQKGQMASPMITEQLIITKSADTGDIIGIEKIDKTGARSQLSEQECGLIAGEDEIDEISAALDDAFAAGIAEAFDTDDDGGQEEIGEDPVLERLIVLRLLGRRMHRIEAMRQKMLRRLVLRRLVRRHVLRNRKERTTV
jgi:hypothetical protein